MTTESCSQTWLATDITLVQKVHTRAEADVLKAAGRRLLGTFGRTVDGQTVIDVWMFLLEEAA